MEKLINASIQLQENLSNNNVKPPYVSCIKLNGRPILPPLITGERLQELLEFKQKAIEIEKRLNSKQKTVNNGTVSSEKSRECEISATDNDWHVSVVDLCASQLENRFSVENSSVDDGIKNDSETISFDGTATSVTLTPSPNLLRQNSYTLLEPSPVLVQYLESQREKEEKRSQSGRKTWDLNRAKMDWGGGSSSKRLDYINGNGCNDSGNLHDELLDYQVTKDNNRNSDNGSTSPSSFHDLSLPKFQKIKGKVKHKKSKPQKTASPKKIINNVPSSVGDDLSALSDLFIKLKSEHEKQKKELEMRQRAEMEELEMLLKKREADFIRATKVNDNRPLSALEYYCNNYKSRESRKTKSIDSNHRISCRDADFDTSFQDSIQSREMYGSKDAVDTDTISNCSSRLSSISSDSKLESMPLLDMRKFRAFDMRPEDIQKFNKAAVVITAAAKGFLTRRLLKTAHVQGLITTLRDAISCATQLHDASDLGESDVELMKRLGRQIEAAWEAVYAVFFGTDTTTKMTLISTDRERLKSISTKAANSDKKRRLSIATMKSMRRKSVSKLQ